MIMKNRKIVFITLTLLVLLFLSQLFVLKRSTSSNSKEIMASLESCTLQNAIFYEYCQDTNRYFGEFIIFAG